KEEIQTAGRQRDDPDACAYVLPAVATFCYSCPATIPGPFLLTASLAGPRQRRCRSKELCQSRSEDRQNLLRSQRKEFDEELMVAVRTRTLAKETAATLHNPQHRRSIALAETRAPVLLERKVLTTISQ